MSSPAHSSQGGSLDAGSLQAALDEVARATGFSGVVRVDRPDLPTVAAAYGLADRRHGIAATIDTRFAIASGSKGLTALAVVGLVVDGELALTTTARSLLGADLPLIRDDVTVEHLLAHTSGIGDYLDEEAGLDLTDYLMPVPVHQLVATQDYLVALDAHPTRSAPGERFAYCDAGYVVLALIAERAAGRPFHDLVQQRVCAPAAMIDTAYLRSDELPGRTATGYLTADSPRTNVFHLPVRGSGDGGAYSTLADVHALWTALFAGGIVPSEWVAELVRPRGRHGSGQRYGMGFWLPGPGVVQLEGCDSGVSFRSRHRRADHVTWTVMSNTTDGAWPLARCIAEQLDPG